MFINCRTINIEWGDCDPAGIVFYPRYFFMFDASTAALFTAALGINKYELTERYGIVGFPMVDTGARFYLPCKYGDQVKIETRVTRFGRSSFEIEHRLFRDDMLAIEAQEKRVWVGRDPSDPQKLKSTPLPSEVVEKLSTNLECTQG